MGVLIDKAEELNNKTEVYPWIVNTDPVIKDSKKEIKWLASLPKDSIDFFNVSLYDHLGIKK